MVSLALAITQTLSVPVLTGDILSSRETGGISPCSTVKSKGCCPYGHEHSEQDSITHCTLSMEALDCLSLLPQKQGNTGLALEDPNEPEKGTLGPFPSWL